MSTPPEMAGPVLPVLDGRPHKAYTERHQPDLFVVPDDRSALLDLSAERPLIGVSGGINSAALLVYLGAEYPAERRPRTVLLFHADVEEHSPDTRAFVAANVRWARRHFETVRFGRHRSSANAYFESDGWIPHPLFSPCTDRLKLEPMAAWAQAHEATMDLIGYVRRERQRVERQQEKGRSLSDWREKGDGDVEYPIAHLSEADCFRLVDEHVGWHPAIYDVLDDKGRPLFRHNNCLPCKNMQGRQLAAVRDHYPEYWRRAMETAERIRAQTGRHVYWGRQADGIGDPCSSCQFD